MNVDIALYGALREAHAEAALSLEVPDGATIGQLRDELAAWCAEQAPAISASLLARSAFATDSEILHDHRAVPEGVKLAVLPPVSGG